MNRRRLTHRSLGFTLIEIMLASMIGAFVLVAVYGIFFKAIKTRDSAMARTRDSRLRARAATVIRNDLRSALISGGVLAAILEGDSTTSDGSNSSAPGYLKFTTMTGKDTPDQLYGTLQQVEYNLEKDTAPQTPESREGSVLVRTITRDLMDQTPNVVREEPVLTGVTSFAVAFYDGANWQESWQLSGTNGNSSSGSLTSSVITTGTTSASTQIVPEAIRVDIQQSPASPNDRNPPPPIEILVPWTTQPFVSPTPSPDTSPSPVS